MGAIVNIGTLYPCSADGPQGELHPITDAVITWEDQQITYAGPASGAPKLDPQTTLDAQGQAVIPGLIDCHTHLAFGGWRAEEFSQRIAGRSYLDIAKSGGGIQSTVKQTRAASKDQLIARASCHLSYMKSLGVTTVECKSGYGLTVADEIKLLEVYQTLQEQQPLTLIPTLLAAHVVPSEYKDRKNEYLDLITKDLIPQVAQQKLAVFQDVFVEDGAFSVEEARTLFAAGKKHGLIPRVHADQLTAIGAAQLAAEVDAASADHLENIDAEGMAHMKQAGVVAVNLPTASLFTFQKPMDARALIDAGLSVAVASDFNPGSAPSNHLPFALMLACTLTRMTPAEAVKGATQIAAASLKLEHQAGSLETGKAADITILPAPTVDHWLYHAWAYPAACTVKHGTVVHRHDH